MVKLPQRSLKGYLVVPLHVFDHVKHFKDVDEDQSRFPDLIDE